MEIYFKPFYVGIKKIVLSKHKVANLHSTLMK